MELFINKIKAFIRLRNFILINFILFIIFNFLPIFIFDISIAERNSIRNFVIMLFPLVIFMTLITRVIHAKKILGVISRIGFSWTVAIAFAISNLYFLNLLNDSLKSINLIFIITVYLFIYMSTFTLIFMISKNNKNLNFSDFRNMAVLVIGTNEISKIIIKKLKYQEIKKIYTISNENIKNATEIINQKNIETVYASFSKSQLKDLKVLQEIYIKTSANIFWLPPKFLIDSLNIEYLNIFDFEGVHLNASNLNNNESIYLKRAFDIVISLISIIFLFPLLILISILIKISSKGPIIFKQPRNGLNAKIFNIYKFRTMFLHESDNLIQAKKNDKRITKIGHFLRKTSLDELPQLFNVLRGDMSIIGPRPHATEHNEYYSKKIFGYMSRHRAKPGMTGLAQVNGLRGETDIIEKMDKRISYDLKYLRNWSLFLDLKILILTIPALFNHKGQ